MTSIAQLIKASEYACTGRSPLQASTMFLNELIISLSLSLSFSLSHTHTHTHTLSLSHLGTGLLIEYKTVSLLQVILSLSHLSHSLIHTLIPSHTHTHSLTWALGCWLSIRLSACFSNFSKRICFSSLSLSLSLSLTHTFMQP